MFSEETLPIQPDHLEVCIGSAREKFPIQSAIFQGTEQTRHMTASAYGLHYGFNNPHDNSDAWSYHRL